MLVIGVPEWNESMGKHGSILCYLHCIQSSTIGSFYHGTDLRHALESIIVSQIQYSLVWTQNGARHSLCFVIAVIFFFNMSSYLLDNNISRLDCIIFSVDLTTLYYFVTMIWPRGLLLLSDEPRNRASLHRAHVATSFWRNNDVVIASCVRWDTLANRNHPCDVIASVWFNLLVVTCRITYPSARISASHLTVVSWDKSDVEVIVKKNRPNETFSTFVKYYFLKVVYISFKHIFHTHRVKMWSSVFRQYCWKCSKICMNMTVFWGEQDTVIAMRWVPDFATDRPCGVWCDGLTTCLLYVGPLLENLVWNDSRFVSLT